VIGVGVGEDDLVDRAGRYGEVRPVHLAPLLLTLEHPRVDEDPPPGKIDEVLGARDGARSTEERQRHRSHVFTMARRGPCWGYSAANALAGWILPALMDGSTDAR